MKPFLNWAGGKRWLVANYAHLLGTESRRYIEPFLGSGAVFFHLLPRTSVLADANPQLVGAYAAVRDSADEVVAALKGHQRLHCPEYYYRVRAMRPKKAATRAARLIYLNRTCFNGLYRVNRRGEFNVPVGSKQSVLLPDDDFDAWANALAQSRLLAQDFQASLKAAGEGDFVYADPPYTVRHNMNNFVKYNERIFSWSDQERLATSLNEAAARGAHVVISNADHSSIRDLYPSANWHMVVVARHSRLAASSKHRRPTTEILFSNRPLNQAHQADAQKVEST